MELLISLISGVVGGNLTAQVAKGLNQGAIVNSLAGLVGGAIGGTGLAALGLGGLSAEGGDLTAILGQVAGGGVGGGLILAVIKMVQNTQQK